MNHTVLFLNDTWISSYQQLCDILRECDDVSSPLSREFIEATVNGIIQTWLHEIGKVKEAEEVSLLRYKDDDKEYLDDIKKVLIHTSVKGSRRPNLSECAALESVSYRIGNGNWEPLKSDHVINLPWNLHDKCDLQFVFRPKKPVKLTYPLLLKITPLYNKAINEMIQQMRAIARLLRKVSSNMSIDDTETPRIAKAQTEYESIQQITLAGKTQSEVIELLFIDIFHGDLLNLDYDYKLQLLAGQDDLLLECQTLRNREEGHTCEINRTFSYFDYAGEFREGFAHVRINENECGFVNTKGQIIIKQTCGFYDLGDFSEGFAAVCKNGKWGYIDRSGELVIDYCFVDARKFSLGLAPVRFPNTRLVGPYSSKELAHQWGYIDKAGKIIIPPQFDDAFPFNKKFGIAEVGNMKYTSTYYGYINKEGDWVIPAKYRGLGSFSEEGLASFDLEDGNDGFIDYTGKRPFYLSFDMAGSFSEGYCPVRNNDYKWGFIDRFGRTVISCKYDYVENFHEGLACVTIGQKHGFINKLGVVIIDVRFDNARDYSEGVAGVKVGNKWGIIDYSGKEIIPPIYDCVFGCHDGLIPVMQKKDNKEQWFFIHKDGTRLIK